MQQNQVQDQGSPDSNASKGPEMNGLTDFLKVNDSPKLRGDMMDFIAEYFAKE